MSVLVVDIIFFIWNINRVQFCWWYTFGPHVQCMCNIGTVIYADSVSLRHVERISQSESAALIEGRVAHQSSPSPPTQNSTVRSNSAPISCPITQQVGPTSRVAGHALRIRTRWDPTTCTAFIFLCALPLVTSTAEMRLLWRKERSIIRYAYIFICL